MELDVMVLNVALPTLANELHASTTDLQWLTGSRHAQLRRSAAARLLGDRFGRKRFLIGAAALFGVALVFAAYAGRPVSWCGRGRC